MSMPYRTPVPSTPSHHRTSSVPRTPSTSQLNTCSSSPNAFTVVKVHTAKCSECDKRNMDVMRRCPGCTFQVCKPCQEKREKGGRSLAHGNMLSPTVATPATGGGSVVRRKPVGVMQGVEMEREKKEETNVVLWSEDKDDFQQGKRRRRAKKPAAKPQSKPKSKVRETTPTDDSSDEDFAPDLASPSANKRRRTELDVPKSGDVLSADGGSPSSFPSAVYNRHASTKTGVDESQSGKRPLRDMTIDEILAHYDVNTSANPYKAHLLSRHEPVVSDPVMQIPEVVKRGFRPRPSAEKIQKNIQDKVREKLGLPALAGSRRNDG